MGARTRNDALLRREVPLENTRIESFSSQRSTSAVYFIRTPRYVKIGYSSNVASRLKTHLRKYALEGIDARCVAAVHGDKDCEDFLKKHFAHLAVEGYSEEFRHDPELTDYIRWLRAQYFVSVADDRTPVEDVEVVDFQGWKPTPERRIAHVPDLLLPQDDYAPRVLTGDDYYTPPELLDRVRQTMGGITLDPASHAVANAKVCADRFYSKSEDGLTRDWYGRVWLNPPFSKWSEFAAKACSELDGGKIDILMALVSVVSLTTTYIKPLLARVRFMIIPDKRYQFWGPMAGENPPSGHVILVFAKNGDYDQNIVQHFSSESIFGNLCINGARRPPVPLPLYLGEIAKKPGVEAA